jgi:uncharacterized membrane protein YbaN (DUF454 family)
VRGFERWSGWRIALICIGWVLLIFGITIARLAAEARAYAREHPSEESYLVMHGTPGGLPVLVGPPLLLVALWLWARRSRRPPED